MNWRHMGPATTMPGSLFMGELSLFPTHTPVTRVSGLYPTTQTSLKSWVVPVFTATCLSGKYSREFTPNMGVRAVLSERMDVTISTASFERTAMEVFVFSWSVVPLSLTTRIIDKGGTRLPPVANTPYADVISRSFTSPPPSTREGPYWEGR